MKFGFKFLTAIYPRFTHESGTIRKKQAIDVSKLKRLLGYESQHQRQNNEKSLVQFDYEKAVSNYLGTQSTFNPNAGWPLQDIAGTNIVWCMAYKRGGSGGSYIAQ